MEKDFESCQIKQRKQLETRLEDAVSHFRSESERSLRKIKDRAEASRLKKAAAGEAAALRRKSVSLTEETFPGPDRQIPSVEEEDGTINAGDHVRIVPLDRDGTAESVMDDTIVVSMGAIRYRAKRSDLRKIASKKSSAEIQSSQESQFIDDLDDPVELELKVIGMNVDEALAEVDKFLDRCYLSGADKIRIIHGHGKGILRQAISEMLRTHLQVEGFNSAPSEQGGSGATIVALKK